jgi:plasmid stabilization system protein ParE
VIYSAAVSSISKIEKGDERMARGDKSSYTEKQKRQAEHIEESYEERGVSEGEAEKRAWATVNKMTGGGKKSGSGRGQPVNKGPAKKGGKKGGKKSGGSKKGSSKKGGSKKGSSKKGSSKKRS